jgi:hypothetical protein
MKRWTSVSSSSSSSSLHSPSAVSCPFSSIAGDGEREGVGEEMGGIERSKSSSAAAEEWGIGGMISSGSTSCRCRLAGRGRSSGFPSSGDGSRRVVRWGGFGEGVEGISRSRGRLVEGLRFWVRVAVVGGAVIWMTASGFGEGVATGASWDAGPRTTARQRDIYSDLFAVEAVDSVLRWWDLVCNEGVRGGERVGGGCAAS